MGPPLEHDPSVCSLDIRVIAGIKTYLYNLQGLPTPSSSNPRDVAVLFIIHGRLNSNKFSESVAYNVQEVYKNQKTKTTMPLICVSFDVRNHGERLIDPQRNEGWAEGNLTHAMDLCSAVDGTVQDCSMLINYLPLIFPGYTMHNYITGTSLGGHVCFRAATELSKKIELIIPIIGCTDICSLLVNRVKGLPLDDSVKGVRKLAYEDLHLTDDQKKLWPEYFHNYISKQDYQVAENFPNHIKVFAIFGEDDDLVPPAYSEEWFADMDSARCYDGSIVKYVYKNTGHESTRPMCLLYSGWLVEMITF